MAVLLWQQGWGLHRVVPATEWLPPWVSECGRCAADTLWRRVHSFQLHHHFFSSGWKWNETSVHYFCLTSTYRSCKIPKQLNVLTRKIFIGKTQRKHVRACGSYVVFAIEQFISQFQWITAGVLCLVAARNKKTWTVNYAVDKLWHKCVYLPKKTITSAVFQYCIMPLWKRFHGPYAAQKLGANYCFLLLNYPVKLSRKIRLFWLMEWRSELA